MLLSVLLVKTKLVAFIVGSAAANTQKVLRELRANVKMKRSKFFCMLPIKK